MKYVIVILAIIVGIQSYFLCSSYAVRTLGEYHYAQMGLEQSFNNVFFIREEKPSPTYLESMLICNIVGNFDQYESAYKKTRELVWLHKHQVESEFNRASEEANQLLGKDIKNDYQYFKEFCYGNRESW